MNIRNWLEEASPLPCRPTLSDALLLIAYGCIYAAAGVVMVLLRVRAAIGRVLRDPHGATTLFLIVLAVVAGRVAR